MTRLSALVAKLSSRLIIIVLVVAAVAFVAIYIGQSFRIREMREQSDQKKAELALYEDRNTQLKQQLEFLQGPGYMLYVELVARQALGLARPDETVILPVQQGVNGVAIRPGQAPAGQKAPTTTLEQKSKTGWDSWWSFFFG
ncbi:MAG: septum formation initiator family protein [Chloroflexi bacterium]|uniref:Septum formation initiator family protein n=1 Tax=Candidatus Chlorohelix allophototropha TaxID=3003348 RepID=A0A8T7M8V9_9CHLR|nr:septum formation initiator family protein [Chloroflexota bacterium]WJW68527.1 septum formation initiator family protein [Chloroflexota bacterium L227-S17]